MFILNHYDTKFIFRKNKNKEIDFVVEKWNDIKYIQVSYLLTEELTIQREFWNLLEIPDNYEKIVLSMDRSIDWDYQWVKYSNFLDHCLWV